MYKKVFTSLLFVTALFGIFYSCSIIKSTTGFKSGTYFPEKASKAYNPKGYTARIIFPVQGKEDIFLKGSSKYNKAALKSSGEIVSLHPPYYTAKVHSDGQDSVIVEFFGDSIRRGKSNVTVYPIKKSNLSDTLNFSFLTFGCFQPFRIVDSAGATMVKAYDEDDYGFRKFFYGLIEKKAFAFQNIKKEEEEEQLLHDSIETGTILKQPKLILATGDQVYVDANTHSGATTKPISAWEISKNPEPLLSPEKYIIHLNEMYSHFWSFKFLEAACAKLPIVSAIDDHEIRDGWGSQEDEYVPGSYGTEYLNPKLKPYFLASRHAFAEHQIPTGPSPKNYNIKNNSGDFHLEFESNGIPVFVFDLRSDRNIDAKISISHKQMEDFEKWTESLRRDQEVIIVSSLPLYWKIPFLFRQVSKLNPELRDDIADFWSNDAYEHQRNRIFEILLNARIAKNIKPIVLSGDVHVGSISEIWYEEEGGEDIDTEPKLLAYEMIVSGFAHENLSEQTFASQLNKMAASEGEIVSGLQIDARPNSNFELEGQFKISAAKLNFGAYEKDSSGSFLHLFLKDHQNLTHIQLETDWEKAYREQSGLLDFEIDDLFVTEDSSIQKRYIFTE